MSLVLGEWIKRNRAAFAAGVSGTVIAAMVVAVAIISPGYATQRVSLNDGAVWVANLASQALGRANPEVLELNTVIETDVASGEVVQAGESVFLVDSVNSTLDLVDPSTALITERIALPSEDPRVLIAGDRVVIHSAGTGEVWLTPLAELGSFDPASPSVLSLGEQSFLSVDDAGVVFAASPELGEVYRLDLAQGARASESWTFESDETAADYQLTSVGGRWVMLDPTGGRLISAAGVVALGGAVELGDEPVLQTPSSSGDAVYLATGAGLARVVLATGTVETLVSGTVGSAAAPVVSDGCVFAAWTGGLAWRDCVGAEPTELALAEMPIDASLAFARNGDQVVLNDARGGASWAVADLGQLIDNWDELITADQQQEQVVNDLDTPPEIDPQQQPPVAVDDEFGARPGRATVLPVLLNDYDANADVLVISEVDQLDESIGRVDLVSRNQQLQLTLDSDARGSFSLRYTITDGRGGTASAVVTVEVRGDQENSPPQQVRFSTATVASGERVSTSVLGDWYDPDGDPFYLSDASTAEPNSVSAKPDGVVVFSDAGEATGRSVVGVTMTDGRESAAGTLEVDVQPRGEVPIVIEPWVVVATAGEQVTVNPLTHVRGGTGTIRLTAVPEKTDVTITPNFEAGTFTLSTMRVGTQYLSFTVTDGDQTSTGLVRVDVSAPLDAGTKPITVPQTVFVRTLASATVDPTLTDIDPAGGVLVVTGVSDIPEGSGLTAEILDQREVRMTLRSPLDDGPVTLHYRISNGVADAEGTITVVEIPEPSRVQAPIATDDAVTVRVGDVVDIPVLDNDEQPDGQELELMSALAEDLPENSGLLFASGDELRYLAPEAAGNYSAVYAIRGEDGQVAQATVRISVREVDEETNSAPIPRTVTARVIAGESVQIDIPLSAVDPDGDAVQLIGVATNPEKGSVVSTAGGSIIYEAGEYSSGTDEFSYTVVDGLGARSEGTIRIGISPRLEGARNPVANEDIVSIRPGRTVSVRVLDNDSDPDGSPLRVVAAVPNAEESGVLVEVVDESIVRITPPEEAGRYSVVYTIENQYGGTSTNFVTVAVDPDAPLAVPVASDTVLTVAEVLDRSTIDVDVLGNVFFADGDVSELALNLVPGYSSSAQVLADGSVRVSIEGASQIIPFSVAHPEDSDVRAFAFLWVPGYDDALPQLDPTAPELVVESEQVLPIALNDYIVALGGQSVRLVDASTVRATHSDGGELVVDDQNLVYTSADRYFGPASITVEVTDGTSADDPDGRRAVLTLPITVEPRENQPPIFVGADVNFEPGQSREFDLIRLTNYPYDDIDELAYTALEPLPEGFTVEVNGQRMVITAALSTPAGTSAVARVGVRDAVNEGEPGSIRLSVVQSTAPLAQPVADSAVALRGETTVLDVLANDQVNNPFPSSPLTVVAIRGLGGADLPTGLTITPSADRSRVTVQVSETAEPVEVNFQYQVADATNNPSRYVWGNATVSVQDVPDPVTSFRVTEFGDRVLKLSWTPGAANNSPITGYEIRTTLASSGSVYSTTTCTTNVNCAITTPGNGPTNAVKFSITAINEVGASTAVSNAAGAIWSDIIPPPPVSLNSASLDKGLSVSWRKPESSGTASPIERYVVTVAGVSREITVSTSDAVGTLYSLDVAPVSGVVNGSSVQYTVSARNSAPNTLATWNQASGTGTPAWTPLVVGTPTASGVSSSSGTTVSAQWADVFNNNGRAITEYRVAITQGSNPPSCSSASSVGTAASTEFTGLSPNRDYMVVVYAKNGLGDCSEAATSARVITRATPGVVTSITTSNATSPGDNGRWDFRLTKITNESASADYVKYRLTGDGVDGSVSELVPVGSAYLVTQNASQYGTAISAEFLACKVWPEVTLCGSEWSAAFFIGTPVANVAPPGLSATVTSTGIGVEGEWRWSAPTAGAYELIQYRCGTSTWTTMPASGGGVCTASGAIQPDDLDIRITANGGSTYQRTYDWEDFD